MNRIIGIILCILLFFCAHLDQIKALAECETDIECESAWTELYE